MTSACWLLSLPVRALGYLCLVAGCAAGLQDVYQSVTSERIVLTPLGSLWYALSPGTLNLLQAGIQRGVHPAVWDPGLQTLLRLPGWLVLFVVATLILLLARLIYQPR